MRAKGLCTNHYAKSRYKPRASAEKEQIKCRSCSGFFTPSKNGQMFCGHTCAARLRRGCKARDEVRQYSCAHCGTGFESASNVPAKYCTKTCKLGAWKKANPERDAEHQAKKQAKQVRAPQSSVYFRTCDVCAKPWTARNALSRVCSVACNRKVLAELGRKYAEQAHRKAARTTRCMHCDCKFSPLYGSSHARACAPCAESVARAIRSAQKDKRKAKYKLNKLDPFKVFDRDGWRCQDCGVSTPRAKRGSYADDAPELDHIRPLSKGGAHSYENTQCLCRRCNAIKSDTWVPETESI